jgi:hypothetical protein
VNMGRSVDVFVVKKFRVDPQVSPIADRRRQLLPGRPKKGSGRGPTCTRISSLLFRLLAL